MSNHPNDPFDDLMRRALHEEADRIEPADALLEIRARAHAQRRPTVRRPWLMTVGAAAIGTAAAIGAFTVFNGTQNTANNDAPVAGPATTTSASDLPSTTQASPAPSPVPSEATEPPTTMPETTTVGPTGRGRPEQSVKSAVVPVYWLGDRVGAPTKSEVRLYRTWARVQGRPAVEAVRIMTSKQPADPDYYSAWKGAQVSSVTRADDLVTVDFKQLPQARLDPDAAEVAAQQLIYTVQGAMKNSATAKVQVTQQGQTGGKLFGQVDTSLPLSRAKADDVQALIWITSPDDRAMLKTPFTVTGIGSAFEAQLNWRIVSAKTGRVVADGATNTSEAFKFTPFAFTVTKLPPGPYTLEVFEISAADGSITSTDSKTLIIS